VSKKQLKYVISSFMLVTSGCSFIKHGIGLIIFHIYVLSQFHLNTAELAYIFLQNKSVATSASHANTTSGRCVTFVVTFCMTLKTLMCYKLVVDMCHDSLIVLSLYFTPYDRRQVLAVFFINFEFVSILYKWRDKMVLCCSVKSLACQEHRTCR